MFGNLGLFLLPFSLEFRTDCFLKRLEESIDQFIYCSTYHSIFPTLFHCAVQKPPTPFCPVLQSRIDARIFCLPTIIPCISSKIIFQPISYESFASIAEH